MTEQGEFKLSDKNPIPIQCTSITLSWLILAKPRILVGCRIGVESYGLTAKYTIIPPTFEAGEKIVNTLREDRNVRDKKLRPGHQRNAPSRYSL